MAGGIGALPVRCRYWVDGTVGRSAVHLCGPGDLALLRLSLHLNASLALDAFRATVPGVAAMARVSDLKGREVLEEDHLRWWS